MTETIKVNRLFHGKASVRSYQVDKALLEHQGLLIVLKESGEQMLVPYCDLISEGRWSKESFKSIHNGEFYKLVDYDWKPTSIQEKLL